MITHLPIFGSILGAAVLFYGMITRSRHTIIAALLIFIVSGLGAIISDRTGDAASETMRHFPGFTGKAAVRAHHEASQISVILMEILGALAIAGIYFVNKKSNIARVFNWILGLLAIVAFIQISWTGYLGGKIRHTEISSPAQLPSAPDDHGE
jgi:uncharacterized membrane protein